MDIIKFVDGMLPWLKKEVNSLLSPLENRLSTLEKREIVHGKDGANGVDGRDGKDADVDFIKTQIFLEVAKLPAAKDGIDGKDGKDADPEYIKSVIAEEVSKVPAAKDGKDADLSQVKALIVEEVAKIPAPKDGKDADLTELKQFVDEKVAAIKPIEGAPGKDGNDGKSIDESQVKNWITDVVGIAVAQIEIPQPKDGADGKSFTMDDAVPVIESILESNISKWALDFERRAQDLLQKCADRIPIPKNGVDGKDGFGFDDLSLEDDGAGNLKFIFLRGDQKKEFAVRVPVFIDRGVFKEGTSDYLKGNGVTWGGSFYIAQKDNPVGKPCDTSEDWRQAVKKGRDYREPVKSNFDPNAPVSMKKPGDDKSGPKK